VPGTGRFKLGAGCTRFSKNTLKIVDESKDCLTLLLNPNFISKRKLSLFDMFTALLIACTLHTRGQGVARKPYMDALMLLATNRNISEIMRENILQEGSKVFIIYCCRENADFSWLTKLEKVENCRLPSLDPQKAGDILVFALDAKLFKRPKGEELQIYTR
jgi:hypothetical protein